MAQRHTELVRAAIDVIATRGGFAWKHQNGTFAIAGGRVMQTGKRGLPDVIGVLPGGRLVAVEAKVGRDPVSDEQTHVMRVLEARGALVVVVRDSIDALVEALR